MPNINLRPTRHIFRQAACSLALAGVLISSLGIAFVPGSKQPGSSQAFPCQGGSCGCSSAAQCWQNCCCNSVPEQLAWADENGVTPPPILFELLAASAEPRMTAPAPETCCKDLTIEDDLAASCVASSGFESPAQLVLLSDLGRCRGLSKYIAIFGGAICEPLADAPAFDLTTVAWLRTHDEAFDAMSTSPPTPPPRVAV